jgi:hypothetical protein
MHNVSFVKENFLSAMWNLCLTGGVIRLSDQCRAFSKQQGNFFLVELEEVFVE